ncbi:MAG: HAMP domain-containing protein [Actinomycetota bacterium]|nr:MAG: HAMP domain-containing protein [Actinomycetota bacterium]
MRIAGPRTLKARLTLIYGGLFFLAGTVLLGVTYLLVDRQLPATNVIASQIGPQPTSQPTSQPTGPTGPGQATGPGQPTGQGQATSQGQPSSQGQPTPTGSAPSLWTGSGEVIAVEDVPGFLAAEAVRLRSETVSSLLRQGAIALVLVGSVSVGLGWLVAGRVLAPLHRVTETARRIASAPAADRGLHERIALPGRSDEVKELADTFDSMLERLDRSFEGQRSFVANASHELRTPLTLNRALVELAMHRKTASADVQQLGEALLQINTRHERLIAGLLLLARSDSEVLSRSPVDLADVLHHVVAQSSGDAQAAGVTLRTRAEAAPTTGDPLLLERLTQNLVDNGIKYNVATPDGFVVVTSGVVDDRVELEVENSGPVIPAYDVPVLFEPFRRLGTERLVTAKGAGLGLSIVRSIARAHGGEVIARAREAGGLVVTVRLPAESS